jgi:Family of unknown function (DUF6502)
VKYTWEIITRQVIRVKYSLVIVLKCNPYVLQDPSMSQTESHHTSPSPALVRALRQVLRPLVRVILAQGITLAYVTELLKSLLVEVAEQDFRIDGKPVSDSRVSLLSGVHRKDVNRLRRVDPAAHEKVPSVVSLGGQLVAQWLGNPLYLDDQGQPKPLPRYISEGGAQSFEGLVSGVNSDIRSRVVLDEWLRLGVVHMDEQRRVCLNTQAFVPAKGFDEKAFYFGHNLHDHASAAAHNLLGQEPAFMERSVHYSGLSAQSVALLAAQSQELGMQALLAVNKTAMELEKLDAVSLDTAHQRMTLGVYFYSQSVQPTPMQAAPTEEPDHEPQP